MKLVGSLYASSLRRARDLIDHVQDEAEFVWGIISSGERLQVVIGARRLARGGGTQGVFLMATGAVKFDHGLCLGWVEVLPQPVVYWPRKDLASSLFQLCNRCSEILLNPTTRFMPRRMVRQRRSVREVVFGRAQPGHSRIFDILLQVISPVSPYLN
jgi:hypothetical protein